MDDLIAFIEARLDEDEAWAREASKPYKYADGEPPAPSGGVHWRWGAGENWDAVEPELGTEIIGEYGQNVQLLTAEEWQSGRWKMSRSYSDHIVEMDSAAAGHIARHDPARVLREAEADRMLIRALMDGDGNSRGPEFYAGLELAARFRAYAWSDHPDYRAEWKP